MWHVLIIHEVADYPHWKRVFDEAAALRKAAGEIRYQLLNKPEDAHLVVHFSEWRSLPAARDFFESEALVAIRQRAGVKAPTFHYLQHLEAGQL